MKRLYLLAFTLCFAITAIAQKKLNPKIGKNETEISLFYSEDYRRPDFYSDGIRSMGGEVIYRKSWRKSTKIGGGLMLARNENSYFRLEGHFYGAAFADIAQFLPIGKRQKWSISGQIGHGIYKEEHKFNDSTTKGFIKLTAGMYYSISGSYRMIISKRVLLVISVFSEFKNFRWIGRGEYYSPPSIETFKEIRKYSGTGVKLGLVF